MLQRLSIAVSLASFLGVGALLFLGHAGAATKVAHWIYFVLVLGVVLGLVGKNVKEN